MGHFSARWTSCRAGRGLETWSHEVLKCPNQQPLRAQSVSETWCLDAPGCGGHHNVQCAWPSQAHAKVGLPFRRWPSPGALSLHLLQHGTFKIWIVLDISLMVRFSRPAVTPGGETGLAGPSAGDPRPPLLAAAEVMCRKPKRRGVLGLESTDVALQGFHWTCVCLPAR